MLYLHGLQHLHVVVNKLYHTLGLQGAAVGQGHFDGVDTGHEVVVVANPLELLVVRLDRLDAGVVRLGGEEKRCVAFENEIS